MLHRYANRWWQVSFRVNESFTLPIRNNKYGWVIEPFTQTIRSKSLIHSETKQITAFMSEALNYSLYRLVKILNYSGTIQASRVCVFVSEPFPQTIRLIHAFCSETHSVWNYFRWWNQTISCLKCKLHNINFLFMKRRCKRYYNCLIIFLN